MNVRGLINIMSLGKARTLVLCLLMLIMGSAVKPLPIANPLTVGEVIEDYLFRFASSDTNTARAKRYDVRYFREFLGNDSLRIENVTQEQIAEFRETRLALGEAPATVRRRLDTIKHLFSRVAKRLDIEDPSKEVMSPRAVASVPKALPADIRERFRSQNVTPRDRAIIEVMMRAGLGRGEIVSLNFGQLDTSEDDWFLRDIRRKGVGFRSLPIVEEARDAMQEYLPFRAELLRRKDGYEASVAPHYPLFLVSYANMRGNPESFRLSVEAVYRMIRAVGGKGVHPHRLRHTFALDLWEQTKDVLLLQQSLGHGDVQHTMRYTKRTDQALAAAFKRKV